MQARRQVRPASLCGGAALGALTVAAFGPAQAQDDSYFTRDRNVSVTERTHPGYAPEPLRRGQFLLRPQLDLAVGWSSNVFALSDSGVPALERYEDESAFYGLVRPSVAGVSDWSRHEIRFDAYAELFSNEAFASERYVNYGADFDGRLDVTDRTALFGGLSYDQLNQSRQINDRALITREPIAYDVARTQVGVRHQTGRLRGEVRFDLAAYDYDDVEIVPVVGIEQGSGDQDFRDRLAASATAELAYAISPDTAVFGRLSRNRQEFDGLSEPLLRSDGSVLVPPRDRDSDGWKAEIGAEFDVTRLLRGQVAVGYFEQDYEDPAYGTASGIGVDAGLEWFPTEMTTLTLTASRDVDQAAFVGAGGVVRTDLVARVDHELRRNVLLYGYAGVGRDEYDEFEQDFDRRQAGVGARYVLSDHAAVGAEYAYIGREVGLPSYQGGFGAPFDAHQAQVTLTLTP